MSVGLRDPMPFEGRDRWTCYEMSWLNLDGVPQVAIVSIEYGALSSMIVESKSLKLFLGSFNFTRFQNHGEVQAVVESNLRELLDTNDLTVRIFTPDEWNSLPIVSPPGESVDSAPYDRECSTRLRSGEEDIHETLYSNLLRSLCPVTSQPDWGTVIISYKGKKLDRGALLTYLIAHRSYQGFHEQCCERIFADIMGAASPEMLWVGCFYTRRGGIDINPERWLPGTKQIIVGGRLARQ